MKKFILLVVLLLVACQPTGGNKAHSAVENLQRYGTTIQR